MKILFVLGRNVELSKAEIFSYFEKNQMNIKKFDLQRNALVIETDSKINFNKIIKELGGTTSVGEVYCSGGLEDVFEYVDKNEIYMESEPKFIYSILNFAGRSASEKLYSIIKNKFKRERLRGVFKRVRKTIEKQDKTFAIGSPTKISKMDKTYFIFKGKEYHFGIIKGVCDSKEIEMRDMEKPVRRAELAISPRLSKILINLSQVKRNGVLLDPFCGIGTILQEALLQNINVIGIDLDESAINGAKKNVFWLNKRYNIKSDYTISCGDSRKARLKIVDGVATEPSLGVLLKRIPDYRKANKMIYEFENLIVDVLNNIKKFIKKGGKISFTAPTIKTQKKRISCDIKKICKATGLAVYSLKNINFPIKEYREDHIVGREIFVLIDI